VTPLVELCQRVRPELACLGELGQPLLEVVTVVERLAGPTARVDALAAPALALDVLSAAGPGADAATVGRVLDFLRQRASAAPVRSVTAAPVVTVAEAVAQYERGALALMAPGDRDAVR
jgi:hypothetical protein